MVEIVVDTTTQEYFFLVEPQDQHKVVGRVGVRAE